MPQGLPFMKAFAIEPYNADRWYLIDAHLPAGRSILRVWAIVRFATHECRISLPASLKGRVFELLPRPKAQHELVIQAEDEFGPLSVQAFTSNVVSGPVAWFWLWHRIAGSFSGMDQQKIKRLSLGWRELFNRPFHSYRLLGSLRYHSPAPEYADWRALYWSCTDGVARRLCQHLQRIHADTEVVQVLIDARRAAGSVEQAAESVRAQTGLSAQSRVLTANSGAFQLDKLEGWVLYMQPGQVLEPWALAWLLTEACAHPDTLMIYGDHARLIDNAKPASPFFKPDWSPEFQRVSHYVGDCVLVKASALSEATERLGYLPDAYELALEVAAQGGNDPVRHIPAVLWHQVDEGPPPNHEMLAAHFKRHDIQARVVCDARGHLRARYDLPAKLHKISIVIPTRDMLHFLKPCVNSILQKTTWPNYEVLILDNQSSCLQTLAYMKEVSADARVRVLAYDHPFNFSAINNFAVEYAEGELVCLLNNDTEVISPDWLDEMTSRLLQPGVGAVGARLYFSDGRVQHAGDVVGPGGCANHLHGIIAADDFGYMNRAVLPQELSAVTAACLLTYRALYRELGGLDEKNLSVAFNDVDFCLRIGEAGYRVLYTPYAELYHYESVSRGKDDNPEKQARAKKEVDYMRKRWADVIERDPFYNPNLNYAKPDFTLGKYPRINWPW
jgi:GT2 family glycosyltransferase